MAKRKRGKLSKTHRTLIIVWILIIAQWLFVKIFAPKRPKIAREAFAKIDRVESDPREAERKKLIAAVYDYRSKHNGTFPVVLEQLIPWYMASVPVDPATKKRFSYTLVNNVPRIGEEGDRRGGIGQILELDSTLIITGLEGLALDKEQLTDAALKVLNEPDAFIYDPTGKSDPFRPFDLSPKTQKSKNLTPLERFTLGQLRLAATLGAGDTATALVETAEGRGYTVKKGTKIGPNGGEVVEILKDRIIILEQTVDFTGQVKNHTFEMRLRTPDQEEKLRGGA
ncbi:MAG TPA: pilus assembly protein PilP [Oligoflexia bacterium]|nr:pilus assembly protein PilP [Oligoflexia bacterium]HMP26769.1 pilus assembly protein PilP [Oligoflexia bacterium]